MGIKEILLIIACVAIVVGVSAGSLIRKKKGKGGCATRGGAGENSGGIKREIRRVAKDSI